LIKILYRLHHAEIIPCWIKSTLECAKPQDWHVRVLEAFLDFLTEECKVNYLDKAKSSIFSGLLELLFGSPDLPPESTPAVPSGIPNVESNTL
jgi:hypothetical protein